MPLYGRCGGEAIGFDVNVVFSGGNASGRLGGDMIGMDVEASVYDVDPLIAACLFAITYYMYKINQRNNHSSGSSGSN